MHAKTATRKPAPRGLHSLSTHIEHVLQNPTKRRIINLSCCHSSNTFCRNLLVNSSRVDLYDIQFLIPVSLAIVFARKSETGSLLELSTMFEIQKQTLSKHMPKLCRTLPNTSGQSKTAPGTQFTLGYFYFVGKW